MFQVCVEIDFAAAHQVPGHPGACSRLHGHNYRALVHLAGKELDELGLLVDFAQVKELCHQVVGQLDHHYLNDLPQFRPPAGSPTSEHLARFIYDKVADALRQSPFSGRVRLSKVTLYESPTNSVTYWEEGD